MRVLLIGAVLIALSSGSAFARNEAKHAKLTSPVKEQGLVAGEMAWRCSGDDCMTASEIGSKSDAELCRSLVKKVGTVKSFDGLDAAQLEKCNSAAKR